MGGNLLGAGLGRRGPAPCGRPDRRARDWASRGRPCRAVRAMAQAPGGRKRPERAGKARPGDLRHRRARGDRALWPGPALGVVVQPRPVDRRDDGPWAPAAARGAMCAGTCGTSATVGPRAPEPSPSHVKRIPGQPRVPDATPCWRALPPPAPRSRRRPASGPCSAPRARRARNGARSPVAEKHDRAVTPRRAQPQASGASRFAGAASTRGISSSRAVPAVACDARSLRSSLDVHSVSCPRAPLARWGVHRCLAGGRRANEDESLAPPAPMARAGGSNGQTSTRVRGRPVGRAPTDSSGRARPGVA